MNALAKIDDTRNNPAAICAEIELAGGQRHVATHVAGAASQTKRKRAAVTAKPNKTAPASAPIVELLNPATGQPFVDGHLRSAPQPPPAIDSPIPDAATFRSIPTILAPQEPHLTAADFPAYAPTPKVTATIDEIVSLHRQRQAVIKAKTKLILQAKAMLRSRLCGADDYEDDDTKTQKETALGTNRRRLTKSAGKRVDDAFKLAKADPGSEFGQMIGWMMQSVDLGEKRQSMIEKDMVKHAKKLPAYEFAKSVKGFGDISFATLVGECGDIGTYKSIAAVWKRLGLAVINGNRQGRPGDGATAQDWVDHGYSGARRSVSWNARNGLIGPNGLWRPEFAAITEGSNSMTYYQKVFTDRARYEAEKLGLPVTCSDKGKDSYKQHVFDRAARYMEKRLVKHLVQFWRTGRLIAAV